VSPRKKPERAWGPEEVLRSISGPASTVSSAASSASAVSGPTLTDAAGITPEQKEGAQRLARAHAATGEAPPKVAGKLTGARALVLDTNALIELQEKLPSSHPLSAHLVLWQELGPVLRTSAVAWAEFRRGAAGKNPHFLSKLETSVHVAAVTKADAEAAGQALQKRTDHAKNERLLVDALVLALADRLCCPVYSSDPDLASLRASFGRVGALVNPKTGELVSG
jgi:predicted nucleic acid-binding protein